MKIEFFHDVICSFCFPMSYRMRQIQQEFPQVEIIHRSFALAKEASNLEEMFGSRQQAKEEILTHWVHANQNDDLHRFNIQGMEQTDFPFPTSKNGLIAAKAASQLGGNNAYWDVFDGLQYALFVENQNIEDPLIIKQVVSKTSIDTKKWWALFNDPQTLELVEKDLQLAQNYQLSGVPALIINQKYIINGAQSFQKVKEVISKLLEEEQPLQSLIPDENNTCTMEDGQWHCS